MLKLMSTAASTMQCTAMPSEPSGVPPPGKESEKPTTSTGVTTASQLENSVHPPFLPSNEIEEDNVDLRSQVQSSWKLPECETAEPTSWPPGTPVLFLSSGTKIAQNSSRQFSFEFQSANSLETYHEATELFMSSAKSQKASEVWIVHEIDAHVTADSQQPVIGGKILSENELCKPFYCRQDSKPIKLHVIYLLRPTESAEPPCSNTRQTVGATKSSDEELTAPKHASLCNSEVHSLVFDSDINWSQVRQAFDQHAETSGKDLTADDLISQIDKCCGAPLSRRMSGVPSADCVVTAFGLDSVDAPNHTSPLIPDVEDESALNRLQLLQRQPSNECVETNSQPCSPDLFISIVVGKYEKDKDSRTGFKEDIKSFAEVAQCLGCSHENVHPLCPDDGCVTADRIQDFFNKLQDNFKSKTVSPRRVFLAVSAHGNEFGIRTSDGKEVPLGELLLPLASLGAFVLLLYQACRGSRSHPTQAGENYQPAFVCSLGFTSPETAGCVLPLQVPKAAAIFASMVGYEAYRNEQDGSWMPRALLDVVRRPGTVTVKQLAELVQARLHEFKVCGVVPCKRRGRYCTAYIQTQYSANEGSENVAIETGLSSGADSQTPEAGHRAAADELAQLELNKPSQPD